MSTELARVTAELEALGDDATAEQIAEAIKVYSKRDIAAAMFSLTDGGGGAQPQPFLFTNRLTFDGGFARYIFSAAIDGTDGYPLPFAFPDDDGTAAYQYASIQPGTTPRLAANYWNTTVGQYEIITCLLDGSSRTILLSNAEDNYVLGWSRDGTKLAFNPNGAHLSVMDANGSNIVALLTSGVSDLSLARWSLDGSAIAIVTGGQARGTIKTHDSTDGTVIDTIASSAMLLDWSPDGSKILYVKGTAVTGPATIYTANDDGTGETAVAGPYTGVDILGGRYSPDGTQVAVTFTPDSGTTYGIAIITLASPPATLTDVVPWLPTHQAQYLDWGPWAVPA